MTLKLHNVRNTTPLASRIAENHNVTRYARTTIFQTHNPYNRYLRTTSRDDLIQVKPVPLLRKIKVAIRESLPTSALVVIAGDINVEPDHRAVIGHEDGNQTVRERVSTVDASRRTLNLVNRRCLRPQEGSQSLSARNKQPSASPLVKSINTGADDISGFTCTLREVSRSCAASRCSSCSMRRKISPPPSTSVARAMSVLHI